MGRQHKSMGRRVMISLVYSGIKRGHFDDRVKERYSIWIPSGSAHTMSAKVSPQGSRIMYLIKENLKLDPITFPLSSSLLPQSQDFASLFQPTGDTCSTSFSLARLRTAQKV